MKTLLTALIGIYILNLRVATASAISPSESEMGIAQKFIQSSLTGSNATLPFSFLCDGKPSSELLPSWNIQHQTRQLDSQRTELTVTCTDATRGLVVRCVAIQYMEFPVVEWTLYFKNNGNGEPILSEIQSLDTQLNRGKGGEFLLHHAKGSEARPDDFQPLVSPLPPKSNLAIAPIGGRPSSGAMPYFNIGWPTAGMIMAIGWPGQWATRFDRNDTDGLRVRAGQELTHFVLRPGEEVRSPQIALLFYQGSWIRSQNLWRRWMVVHNLPQVEGKPLQPAFFACSSSQFGEMWGANDQNQEQFIKRYLEEGLKIDYWWMDTGWYVNTPPPTAANGFTNNGTTGDTVWEVDTNRFKGGLRAISDYARSRDVGTLVWFEPERVPPDTHAWLHAKHPDWLLPSPPEAGTQMLLNLGNSDARDWLTSLISRFIKAQGVDVYREDFNMDPLPNWRANDSTDRQGIDEIKYVEGYEAYWDALRRRNPALLFDSCASGGRRLDMETMSRAVSRTRTDYEFNPEGGQSSTYGLALWLPYYGTGFMDPVTGGRGLGTNDDYVFRSVMCPSMTWCCDVRRQDLHYAALRKELSQWKQVSSYMLGDYYPLTSYSTSNDIWMAWQFDRPDLNEGMVEAFRRSESAYEAARFKLSGLDPAVNYKVTNLDRADSQNYTGRQLMEEGLIVTIDNRPGSVIIAYKKQD
jgi:alpha-galactosidase